MQPSILRRTGLAVALAIGASATSLAGAHETEGGGLRITPLVQKAFPDIPGREGLVITVELPPGFVDKPHRHDAHVFVYMLEGSMETRVEGGPTVTLRPGDSFYETPADVHVETRNSSASKPAKFLVFFVKRQDAPPVLPVTSR